MKQDMNDTFRIALRAMVVAAMTLLTVSTAMAQVKVYGNVYGGGNLADVKDNAAVNMSAGHVYGNVFGGGKGESSLFTCEKAMVGVEGSGAGADLTTAENRDKGTIVTISNGTVGTLEGEEGSQTLKEGTGNVYGGGEIGRVEWNTQVKIGVGTGEGTFAPVIYGSVFGAGKGLATHGYSALVRGNSTVTIQGGAQVGYNVYGGGEMSTVGRYWVKGINNNVDGAPKAPEDLPVGMPYQQQSGGICSVTIQGSAEIGSLGIDDKGHVFGAGKGVEPHFVASGEGASQKMVKGDSENPDRLVNFTNNETTGQTAEEAYLEFLQTLSLVTNSYVTIDGSAQVIGSVFGGSESGFVQHDTNVAIKGSCEIGTDKYGNIFGGGKGLEDFAEAGKVKGNTKVTISSGTVKGNVYGGGRLGDVGLITKPADYNYTWNQSEDNIANTLHNNTITGTNNNTGICTVTISGGTIGVDNPTDPTEHGNVFGAGKGVGTTFWCEKAIAYATNVSVSGGTVKGNVYGGGQVGRVEDDAKVSIGGATEGTRADIKGSVFGAGAGLATHGYSALVRGNTKVTVEGYAKVAKSVYGGGETASVGRYGLNAQKMPNILVGGGECELIVQGNAEIGENVFGACKGVTPTYNNTQGNDNRSKRMVTYDPYNETIQKGRHKQTEKGSFWDPYDDPDNPVFVWEYFTSSEAYLSYLETLALATHPEVTIDGSATINGSVFGGGELGLTKGSVIVNIQGGTVEEDVYGGGALADTNTTEKVANNYPTTTPETDTDGNIVTRDVYPTTTVNLLGGIIKGDAYGGGLGRLAADRVEGVHYTQDEIDAAQEGDDAYGKTTEEWKVSPVAAVTAVPATVHGDISVNLGSSADGSSATGFYITTYSGNHSDVIKSGRIFGCNNLNGSPQGNVRVTVWKTVTGNTGRTAVGNLKIATATHSYNVAAVYGGGNLANYAPTKTGKKASVRIETCEVSIESVYGGGNAAEVPETNVLVRGAYEINEVFGGGNGKDPYTLNGTDWIPNAGANVNSNATTLLTGGLVHGAYGGSNKRGTIYGNVSIDTGTGSTADNSTNAGCKLDVEKLVGAGKDADVNGDLIMVMGCKPNEKIPVVYAGADNANVNGDVMLTITSGKFGKVFGGNNAGGYILGRIRLNIEETADCDPAVPIEIDELYLGGNEAEYSMYGYYNAGTADAPVYKSRTAAMAAITDPRAQGYTPAVTTMAGMEVRKTAPYAEPELNIISCTKIDKVYGGGFGAGATLYGDPIVNINMIPGQHTSSVSAKMTELGLPSSDNSDKLGIIGDVFGGGNAAKIEGSTTVNIGTSAMVNLTSIPDDDNTNDVDESLATVKGAYIVGNVYGGGNEADVTGNTFVNICAKEETDGTYTSVAFAGASGVKITSKTVDGEKVGGNVFGGGKGKADTFTCEKAMIGINGAGADTENYPDGYSDGNTSVIIGNGTVDGTVYGGGEIGRVEMNTTVTIGLGEGAQEGETETSAPVIKGNVFGAGKGLETHGYAALVRGNPTVTVQAGAKVLKSVYGGGEIASVARYDVQGGAPVALAEVNGKKSGDCTVRVLGNAEIGPEEKMVMHHVDEQGNTVNGTDGFPLLPDDAGHVFAAGKGILPKNYSYADNDHRPKRMLAYNEETISKISSGEIPSGHWEYSDATNKNIWQYFKDEAQYFEFIQTLALATQTRATISGNAFVKGSVYGGSENGLVQYDTHVTIDGNCQIGCGRNTTKRHPARVWGENYTVQDEENLECASWEFDTSSGAPYDPYAKYLYNGKYYYDETHTKYAEGGSIVAKDGHTFYGNVFGGGSGSVPYYDTKEGRSRYIMSAGWVKGDTYVTINGGHILTNVYGGNEATNVDGTAHVTMTDGTIGVPRTLAQIDAHPVTCYLFGAGKGDQRVFFNKDTNVKDAVVNITGGRIYGSVFGGGEDGHVLRNVTMTIGQQTTTGEGDEAVTTTSGPTIGNWGTSYVDGNVFGGGRGFGGDAYTAGNVAGSITMEIIDGRIYGSIYGGGRLGSVGYGLFDATTNNQPTPGYGTMRDDADTEAGFTDGTTGFFTNGRGHIDITISGGTIGNDYEYIIPNATNIAEANITETDISKWTTTTGGDWDKWKTHHHIPKTEFDASGHLTHTKGGNVFAGGMGRFYQLDGSTYISSIDWWKLGCVKSTKLTITGGTIKSNVYGGGELGQVVGHHTTNDDKLSTEISISGNNTQIGTEVKNGETTEYTFGSVFGSGYGSLIQSIIVNGTTSYPRLVAGLVKEDTKIDMQGGAVKASIYGGGEMASVGETTTSGETTTVTGSTYVSVSGGTVGIEPITVSGETRYFGGAKMGNVYGGGSGNNGTVRSGKIFKNTNVNISGGTIYHNVYGGGAYGTVGDFEYIVDGDNKVTGVNKLATEGTGVANVTIIGGTLGYDGCENGMVFGSSRGDIAEPDARDDYCAYVYDTHVVIGTKDDETAGPQINGSVYGSGENGHTFNDTEVIIHSGTIGIETGSPVNGLSGANYPTRGNVYGGGCGTDTYEVDDDNDEATPSKNYFNRLSGIVRGNTSVKMDGGHVVRSIYGGGAMGSVGVFSRSTTDASGIHLPGSITGITSGGKCTINISGGKVGPNNLTMPTNAGMVFGAGRGEMHDLTYYPNLERVVYVDQTDVTITGTAFIKGSVYGGSESGHVFGNTHVTIDGNCQIGCGYDKTFNNGEGKDLDRVYTTDEWAYDVTSDDTKFLYECNSWPFQAPYTPYDKFAKETGYYDDAQNQSADNARPQGSDGHTFYGNVFGGGSGFEPYAPGKWLPTAGWVQGNTLVEIKGGHILTSVYGGNEMSDVGSGGVQKMTDLTNVTSDMFYDITKPGGKCTVKMSGGTLGVPRTLDQIAAHPLTCYLFGAGKGDQRIFFNKTTNVKEVEIEISGGRIYGSVFGGGEDGHVMRDVKMTIKDGSTTTGEGEQAVTTTTSPIIGTWGTSYVDGNVFGGGRGFSGEALTAGNVGGSVNIDIQGGTMFGSIYGGGRLGSVGYGLYLVDETIGGVKPYGILCDDNVDDRGNAVSDFKRGYITINISGGTIGNTIEYKYNPTDADKQKMPSTQFDYQNHLTYTRGGNVFTGCMGRLYALDNRTLLPLWTKLGRCRQTELNITGGTIKSNVYGGAELGAVQQNATVRITGGTIGTKVADLTDQTKYYYYGSAFGSGKGSNDAITYPEGTAEADKTDISEAGTVEGNVTVELNKDVAESENKKGGVVRKIFGCNDMNGTPKGTVTVHVYATQKEGMATLNDKAAKAATAEAGTYDVEAVYGGGNLAAYVPTAENTRANVIIDGCGLTSIGTVYGGGNAASVPATDVTVNGTYEIGYVFGGGNGKDKLSSGSDNPGANVGYLAYTNDSEKASKAYGIGKAHATILGGTVHKVFGGSNKKGNVRVEARTTLIEGADCEYNVGEAYGGGNDAPMDGDAILDAGCIPGLDIAYGGAANADVNGDVILNITNGTYGRVFGGNDQGGVIRGTITVNIEEIGCRPIVIGQLYGGGNLAPYSVENIDHSRADINFDDPTAENYYKNYPKVNVKSFTSIGTIFGGGYGSPATLEGNPQVNVNVYQGKYCNTNIIKDEDNIIEENAKIVGVQVKYPSNEDPQYATGYPIPSHAKGAIGAINDVFGGGNEAKVIGSPTVNIGTEAGEEVYAEVYVKTGESVKGYCTRTGDGTTGNPYQYSEPLTAGTATEGTTYYLKTTKAVDIRGNVYGGGNNADVQGDTNVVIGKKAE